MQKMKYTINTDLEIEAAPEEVWQVFGDFARWGDWNEFMQLPVVPEKVGKTCRVLFNLERGCMRQSVHTPEVLVLDVDRELRWRDYRGPLVSQFFRGSHWWILQPLPNGHTRLVHGAEMMGLLLPFIRTTMDATRDGYHQFNKALRQEVLARVQKQRQLLKYAAEGKPVVTVLAGGEADFRTSKVEEHDRVLKGARP